MTTRAAHKGFWQTSDALVIITLGLGTLLEKYVYEPGPIPIEPLWRYIIGGSIIAVGVVLILLAHITLRLDKQPSAPGLPTTKLVERGIFKISRNPLYLGVVIAVIGIGLSSDYLWYDILSPALVLAFNLWMIKPEEKYLLEEFGSTFADYQRRVRRWL